MAAIDYGCLVKKNGEFINKNGDLFFNVGGLEFYKCSIGILEEERYFIPRFKSETTTLNGIKVTVRNLNDDYYSVEHDIKDGIGFWFSDEDVPMKHHARLAASIYRSAKKYHHFPRRWVATFDYDGDSYEIIFGYGIDPSERVWNDVKNYDWYDFTENEIKIIDEWF